MSKDEDLRSLIQQQLRQRDELRKKAERMPAPSKPGARPDQQGQPVEPPQRQPPPPQPARRPEGYRFLNPYNFVRYLPEPRPKDQILGSCPPPPHDRFLGYTGRITCTLEAVTPLFISDSHEVKGREGEHRHYRFFQVDKKPVLPGSSLRGMIRSVFEAVTNSCFAVFQEDNPYPLEHREARAPDMIPARVVELNQEGGKLELLDCSDRPGSESFKGSMTVRAAAVEKAYPPRVLLRRGQDAFPFVPHKSCLPSRIRDGVRVAALVTREPRMHGSKRYRAYIAETVVPVDRHETLQPEPHQQKVYGWLHLTGPNIENKHDERLFFRWDDRSPSPPDLSSIPDKYIRPFDQAVTLEYNYRMAEYWERNRKQVDKLGTKPWSVHKDSLPHPSSFVSKDRNLQKGDLVYVLFDASKVSALRPVSMPRVSYRHKRQDLLKPESLHHCRSIDELCPACRIFGWVHSEAATLDEKESVAYAGRVRLSHGRIPGESKPEKLPDSISLAILSTPKPTTTVFYLLDKDFRPSDVDYDTNRARLRGRKVYRHFGKWEEWSQKQSVEFRRAGDKQDDQNRTITGVLAPGAKFIFDLDFENLSAAELGALLWALELEDGMYHRLGLAKPLGFGSVKVTIDKCRLLRPLQRYANLSNPSVDATDLPDLAELKKMFKGLLASTYSSTSFDLLPNIQDLKKLLGEPDVKYIHYPRSEPIATEDGENFKWFVGNKRRLYDAKRPVDKQRLLPPQMLPLPTEDTEGFTLMDEKGEPT